MKEIEVDLNEKIPNCPFLDTFYHFQTMCGIHLNHDNKLDLECPQRDDKQILRAPDECPLRSGKVIVKAKK